MPNDQSIQQPPSDSNLNLPTASPCASALGAIVQEFLPNLTTYSEFYRQVHRNPELSSLEAETAALVARHLLALDFKVHTQIGGHGVVGILKNGPGKTILTRAELDALPIREQTDLAYKSSKTMTDRYGNERPVMHACGHDMNMAALLAASALLHAARERWSGTLITLFQPDEEETGGARAMLNDGLYSKIPVPDVLLAQHVIPLAPPGKAAVQPGPVLVAADAINVRVTGGPCKGSLNPQICVDSIQLSTQILTHLPAYVRDTIASGEDATVACWGFHAGIPGIDYPAHADFLLDVKTRKEDVRQAALKLIEKKIRDECRAANAPKEPEFKYSVRAPLTSNDKDTTERVQAAFEAFFGAGAVPVPRNSACEDFPLLAGERDVPYTYWFFGGCQAAEGGEVPTNHSPFFAPEIETALKAGTEAMALAVLAFVGK